MAAEDRLQYIQQLQFHDKPGAEAMLLAFVRQHFQFDAAAVELRPSAVSLNSFNGFMTLADGKRLFFKTHTETDTIIDEYYQADVLAKAGYPVIMPVFSSTEVGKQFLAYEVIESPSVFDTAWHLENDTNFSKHPSWNLLQSARHAADMLLNNIYLDTLSWQTAEDHVRAPIHQLFFHRLQGGRLERFYGSLPGAKTPSYPDIQLPGRWMSMREVRNATWVINQQEYAQSLDDLIAQALSLLKPDQEGPSILGHGDAHNGNVFLVNEAGTASLLYFDPAFAGRHHPLLDLTKPLFHNVFAMWMYFPHEKLRNLNIEMSYNGAQIHVRHDDALHPVRSMFLESKVRTVLLPILQELSRRGWLRSGWRHFLKAALFCCPFLTMNLADSTRFPPEISLLGLAMAVEMGAESIGRRSLIDQTLDQVEINLMQAR